MLLCVFVIVCFCIIVDAQVASLCRPNERFLACGCPRTCRDPAVNCEGICITGCYCEEGEFRNDEGLCVKLADCPLNQFAFTLDTSEPRPSDSSCPINEEYRFCEPCTKTCDNPNPICPAQCSRGCFCVEGLLRNDNGLCVKPEECKKLSTPSSVDQEYQITCSANQEFKNCGRCDKTCSDPNPVCTNTCVSGCFCKPGYFKAPDGLCVKLEDCPQAEMSIGEPRLFSSMEMVIDGSPTIEDCAPDEVYFDCGWCEPSCSYPRPSCSYKVCTTGCLCRPPLLRHRNGRCVEEKDCFPKKCKHRNEEYVCRYGCELRCGIRSACALRLRKCVLGCHCKLGLYRDVNTGLCVTKEQCSNATDIDFSVTQNTSNLHDIV